MLHHSYLYEGSPSDFDAVAKAARSMLDLTDGATLDVVERRYEKFGIDDSRELIQLASLRGIGDLTAPDGTRQAGRSLFVTGISQITTEAQQALLKLLEEPREGLTFVILMPHGVVLPTLRSRMMPLELNQISNLKSSGSIAQKFLAASTKERSDMLAKTLKADDAKEQLRALLSDMESLVYHGSHKEKMDILAEIAALRPYLSDRSPSLKMIGEHLAAILPKM